jgi:hypothetical protein
VVLPEIVEDAIWCSSGILAFATEEPEIAGRVEPTGCGLPTARGISGSSGSLGSTDTILINKVGTGHGCRNEYPVSTGVFPEVTEESDIDCSLRAAQLFGCDGPQNGRFNPLRSEAAREASENEVDG